MMDERVPSRFKGINGQNPVEGSEWLGQITVCFSYAQAGWVLLWISTTAYLQAITIYLSDASNPFVNLLDWLEAIAEGRLPAEVNIDEEGKAKTLYAAPAAGGLIDFQILDRYNPASVLWGCRCAKRQLIAEFVAKYTLFSQQYFKPDEWRFEPRPDRLNFSNLKAYLKDNPGEP